MFQRFHALKERNERGFTLIELLVVILIIAVLAAIAIPAFLKQREKGWEGQQQSALKNAATAAESFATGNNGSYSGLDTTALADNGFTGEVGAVPASGGSGAYITVGSADADSYCLVATHATLGNTTAATDWGVASYGSGDGEPKPVDTCS